MLSTDEIVEAEKALVYPQKRGTEELRAYRQAQKELLDQWKEWLAAEYLPGYPKAKTDKVFAKAWDDNHSEGYRSVEYQYEEIAGIIK